MKENYESPEPIIRASEFLNLLQRPVHLDGTTTFTVSKNQFENLLFNRVILQLNIPVINVTQDENNFYCEVELSEKQFNKIIEPELPA